MLPFMGISILISKGLNFLGVKYIAARARRVFGDTSKPYLPVFFPKTPPIPLPNSCNPFIGWNLPETSLDLLVD